MLLLRDKTLEPSDKVLKLLLDKVYPVYLSFIEIVTNEPLLLDPQWKYYKDGNAWLCKITYKKKTVSWMSIWEGYFNVTTYFSEKYLEEVNKLPIDKKLIKEFHKTKIDKKYSKFSLKISSKKQFRDLFAIMEYKKNQYGNQNAN
jgi:hypothetical protein